VTGAAGARDSDRPRRITIDLDGAWCYRRIHGLEDDAAGLDVDAVDDPIDDALLIEALPRILDVCARWNTTATLFVVGRDARDPRTAELLRAASDAGHDLQAHSYGHAYGLSRWPSARIHADVIRALDAIEALGVPRPTGFRAPGYNLSPALVAALVDAGVRWSSSVLPSPAYFALRALVIARTRWAGRQSSSLVGDARAFRPRRGGPFEHDDGSVRLREIPMTTAAGLPWTGTTLALLPDAAADALTSIALKGSRGDELVFELHAADFADGRHLPAEQPDARVPLADKLRRVERAIARVVAHR
jgi:peptidoglycan/xylan/chitin deacetylase (PgdA/CDA1 family)